MLRVRDAVLAWNPGTSEVIVVPRGAHVPDEYRMTGLACFSHIRELTDPLAAKAFVYIEAMHLIVRDRCDPDAVHRALLAIEEYRDGCAEDMPLMGEAR